MPATGPASDSTGGLPALRALQPAQPEDPEERANRKRRQIRRAAVGEFLRKGYVGTSMDDVAAAARVSKQTVYKHFGSKEELFVAIIEATVGEVMDEVFEQVGPSPDRHGELAQELLTMGRRLLVLIMQPELLALRRLVTGEANRFPQLGQVWWRGGPARLMAELAGLLRQADEDGELAIDDPQLAAQQLQWLILSIPINKAMLCPDQVYTDEELYHYSDAGVRTFLAAYRPAGPAPPGAAEPAGGGGGSHGDHAADHQRHHHVAAVRLCRAVPERHADPAGRDRHPPPAPLTPLAEASVPAPAAHRSICQAG